MGLQTKDQSDDRRPDERTEEWTVGHDGVRWNNMTWLQALISAAEPQPSWMELSFELIRGKGAMTQLGINQIKTPLNKKHRTP